jgi:hypothetical protein
MRRSWSRGEPDVKRDGRSRGRRAALARHGGDDLRQQREGADLARRLVVEEHAAVPAGLEALRDDRVDAARGQPARLVDGGGTAEHLGAAGAHALEQLGRRQAEMKAHHGGPELGQQRRRLGAERRAAGAGRHVADVEAELAVVGRERGAPCRLARGIGHGRRVAEEVDVEGPRGLRPDRRQLVAQRGLGEQRAGQRAEPAGVADGDRQRAALHAGHWRLDDWQLDSKQLGD